MIECRSQIICQIINFVRSAKNPCKNLVYVLLHESKLHGKILVCVIFYLQNWNFIDRMCFHISIMTSNYPSTKANNLLSVSKAVAGCSSAAHLAHLFVVYLTNASVFSGIKYECNQFRY